MLIHKTTYLIHKCQEKNYLFSKILAIPASTVYIHRYEELLVTDALKNYWHWLKVAFFIARSERKEWSVIHVSCYGEHITIQRQEEIDAMYDYGTEIEEMFEERIIH